VSKFQKGDVVRVSFEAPWYLEPKEGAATIALGFTEDGTLIGLSEFEAIGPVKVEKVA
jgi:hypothetical protein